MRIVPLLTVAILLGLGCNDPGSLVGSSDEGVMDTAGKRVDRVDYTWEIYMPEAEFIPCLDETVAFEGMAYAHGTYHVTPSGNYVDMLHMAFDTEDPYVLVRPNGDRWAVDRAEDNSGWFSGQNNGLIFYQANETFVSPDGKSRVKIRGHLVADELIPPDYMEYGGVTLNVWDWKCHLAE